MGCICRKEKTQYTICQYVVFFYEEEKEGDNKEKRDCPMKEWNNYSLSEEVFGYNKKSVVKDYFTTEKPVIKDYLITENKE